MPKRTSTVPLPNAFFASGEVAVRLWSQLHAVLEDFERVAKLEAPDFPQEPDEAKLLDLHQHEERHARMQSASSEWFVNNALQETQRDLESRELQAKREWLRSSYEEVALRHEDWHHRIFSDALSTGEANAIATLNTELADKPFLLWRCPPQRWSCSGGIWPRQVAWVLPIYVPQGNIVTPLLDSIHRVAPLDASKYGLGQGYLFDGYRWELSESERHFNEDEVRLLILEAYDAERRKIERLRRKFSDEPRLEYKREPIPESVRTYVWRREGGRCVKCGSQERLEFDHIIPVSLGGSNTERNIQLLCEPCNRRKSNSI